MKHLRRNFRRLCFLMLGLFLVLGGYFAYSVHSYGGRWFASANNPRLASQKNSVNAGTISDRSGILLAYTDAEGRRAYAADPAVRRAVSHAVGDSRGIVSNGAETFFSGYLLGFEATLGERVEALFTGKPLTGDDLTLTLDAQLCARAAELLSRYEAGAAVLLNYRTGEILLSVSAPDFDPSGIDAVLAAEEDNGALVNRVTQGLYPPGSTFKIITLASALGSLPDAAERVYECTGELPVERTTVTEASQLIHGTQTLREAFAQSCNVTFAGLALELGYNRLARTASEFGFDENFLFRDLVVYNSAFPTDSRSRDDLAWAGIGQGRVLVSPLHMALIAGAIANDGVMMEPTLLAGAVSPSGQPRTLAPRRTYKRVAPAGICEQIASYMVSCVQSGTGSRARVAGLTVGGKTGSAENSDDKSVRTHAWFVGFIRDDAHPLAVAVIVEHGGSGGSVAAPIAGALLEEAVARGY